MSGFFVVRKNGKIKNKKYGSDQIHLEEIRGGKHLSLQLLYIASLFHKKTLLMVIKLLIN